MHKLHTLKTMLVKELEKYGDSGNITKSSLETIDQLAHAAKNVCKIIDCCTPEEFGEEQEAKYTDEEAATKLYLYEIMATTTDERMKTELGKLVDRI